ncbi:hypothetical protein ACGFNP_25675 [Nonomuraea sp. NPDC049269]|uniref:hypothetical protein n=1 Tax=Nonomuraea sp. NPDC049269 TaxID=3364349 RepID=UPI0037218E79
MLATSALTDPGALAKEVSKRVPDDHLREAFDEMIRTYVQKIVTGNRTLILPPAAFHEVPTPGGKVRPVGRSKKVAEIREAWRVVLRERINIGPAAEDWKVLADCDTEDLLFAETARRDLAARNLANADQLKGLRDLLAEHGKQHVRDLPDSVLAAYFGGGK